MTGDSPYLIALNHLHSQIISITDGITPEQAAYKPGGTANPIAPTLHHIVAVHDRIVNEFFSGKESQWSRRNWAERLGLPSTFRLEPDRAEFERFDLVSYRAYMDAVFADAVEVVSGLTDEDLDREVLSFRGTSTIRNLLGRTLLLHPATHLGEIAAVKGLQGLKGLP